MPNVRRFIGAVSVHTDCPPAHLVGKHKTPHKTRKYQSVYARGIPTLAQKRLCSHKNVYLALFEQSAHVPHFFLVPALKNKLAVSLGVHGLYAELRAAFFKTLLTGKRQYNKAARKRAYRRSNRLSHCFEHAYNAYGTKLNIRPHRRNTLATDKIGKNQQPQLFAKPRALATRYFRNAFKLSRRSNKRAFQLVRQIEAYFSVYQKLSAKIKRNKPFRGFRVGNLRRYQKIQTRFRRLQIEFALFLPAVGEHSFKLFAYIRSRRLKQRKRCVYFFHVGKRKRLVRAFFFQRTAKIA